MRKGLIIPRCDYCSSDCTPMGEKKYKSMKAIFCSDTCKEKNIWLNKELKDIDFITDEEARQVISSLIKNHIDLKYTAKKILTEESVVIFTNSLYSFKIQENMKDAFYSALDIYSDKIMGKARSVIRQKTDKKVKIIKPDLTK